MERPTTDDMKPKRDQERDLELDKKIEALRRKNEALMKRYKEVEEDRKKAEKEGMALQSRKGKADDLTITISKSTSDSRVVVTKPSGCESPAAQGQQGAESDRGGATPTQAAEPGQTRQLTVTMAGKKGKRVVREKPEKRSDSADIRNPTKDGQARRVESARRRKQPPPTTKRDAAAEAVQEEAKQEQRESEELNNMSEQCQDPENQQGVLDLNIPTSREEHEEYLRWKREREQIDKERVARHKNAKGQWRRAWDVDKTENMFAGKSLPDGEWGASSRGGRTPRRKAGSDLRGHEKRGKDKAAKNVLVMSSKAKGKDRLTGRARRWQANEDGENPQTTETTLEEFLEELDALTKADGEEPKDPDSTAKVSPDPESLPEEVVSADGLGECPPAQAKPEVSSPRGSEKRVRFSEELIQKPPVKQKTASQESGGSESKGSLNASSPKKIRSEGQRSQPRVCQNSEAGPSSPSPDTEHTKNESKPAEKAKAAPHEGSLQPVERTNISNTNTEKLLDSGLSVLSKESGESHPTHTTSSDKAREHGKIV
ncbi:coiled-coil domain-containing protein 9B isoform X2 [Oryzias melastigma]|uniref:Coiled-coil domain containing 9B n=1 Tax=Oryzias melastigma TaxID=30732 RepID=A0A3B3CF14_ORYME|nr:coiled-coil domain-containing protein 9B isoform X2 [Oryzias melastigma]